MLTKIFRNFLETKIKIFCRSFFKKNMAQSRSLFVYFRPFHIANQLQIEKHRWSAWDSNPGPQDGRRR